VNRYNICEGENELGKNINDLLISREIRKDIIDKYGSVPSSIWDVDYSQLKQVTELDERKQDIAAKRLHENMKSIQNCDGDLRKAFSTSGKGVRGKKQSSGISTFPPNICRNIVLFYSEQGETILDPFAGHNSRMEVVWRNKRNYIGYDISVDFMKFNERVREKIIYEDSFLGDNNCKIELKNKTSEKLDEIDNSIDLIFSSPPYWDLEFYGNEIEQLGKEKEYEGFLNRLETIFRECYRVLKQSKFFVININDFRKDGIFYSYHNDIINLYRKIGFKMHDVIIMNYKQSIAQCFASQIETRKTTAKIHEYLIVGKR